MAFSVFEEGLPKDPTLAAVAKDFLTGTMEQMPFVATDLGIHQWDDAMVDVGEAQQRRWHTRLANLRRQLHSIQGSALSAQDWADWTIVRRQADLAWSDATDWSIIHKDPNWYNGVISESIMSLSRRKFGDPQQRAKHLVSRLQSAPDLLETAKQILDNPPRLFVELAIDQFHAATALFEGLPGAFKEVDSMTLAAIETESQTLIKAYHHFIQFLMERWLPKASGDYRLGEARYRARLGWQEGVDEPLPRLLERGYDELNRLRTLFAATATQIDPHADIGAIMKRLSQDRPAADQVLNRVRSVLDELYRFTVQRPIVSLPPGEHPLVVETPAYLRMTTLASINPVGPFETTARESYYQVTLPDADSTGDELSQQLAEFNPWTLRVISAHEVYPGHYAQFLCLPRCKSTVRKMLWSGAFVEGWAHYTEELMIEEGYGDGDPFMRLAQVQEALVRVGRFIVGIRLHVGDMTVEEAEAFFQAACLMSPKSARREALRGTMDPFYLIYTYGKLEIVRLREQARKKWGSDYSLTTFHDRMLAHGAPTFDVLERLLLGPDSQVTS
jgi:uncharacterized protein (DUF885 family)